MITEDIYWRWPRGSARIFFSSILLRKLSFWKTKVPIATRIAIRDSFPTNGQLQRTFDNYSKRELFFWQKRSFQWSCFSACSFSTFLTSPMSSVKKFVFPLGVPSSASEHSLGYSLGENPTVNRLVLEETHRSLEQRAIQALRSYRAAQLLDDRHVNCPLPATAMWHLQVGGLEQRGEDCSDSGI